jgi:THO complex subunit 7
MEAIRTEHDTQNRTIQGQKIALDTIVSDLESLRFLGKDKDTISHMDSPATTPALESGMDVVDNVLGDSLGGSADMDVRTGETGEIEERQSREGERASSNDTTHSLSLNPSAKPFYPQSVATKGSGEEEDIEMGEVSEGPKNNSLKGKRKLREELEEGEASDSSSALSEPPD